MEMDLSCSETLDGNLGLERRGDGNFAEADPALDLDRRLIPNVLDLEAMEGPIQDYFSRVQPDVLPYMRKVVTTWMLEVCEEQLCENQVFPLAVRYVDRFLCARAISRQQLQLLAVVGLLLASKVRQCSPLSVQLLCAYTDHSVTPQQVREWEVAVLGTLRWQTASVTAFDLVDPLVARLAQERGPLHPSPLAPPPPLPLLVRRHAHTLVAVACTESEFVQVLGSKIAGACVCAAARGLAAGAGQAVGGLPGLVPAIASMLRMSPVELRHLADRVELMLVREAGGLPANQVVSGDSLPLPSPPLTPPSKMLPSSPRQPNTPTDVQDILF